MLRQERPGEFDLGRSVYVSGAERLPDAAGRDGFADTVYGVTLWYQRPAAETTGSNLPTVQPSLTLSRPIK